MNFTLLSTLGLVAFGALANQTPPSPSENAARMAAGLTPIYRVTSTARTARAVSYLHRSGATKIDFKGTDLMPGSRGEAKVESKQGYIEIEVEFDNLRNASLQGGEYLTYVLWAISPEGRTANLGEILLNGTKSKLNVTTELQVFGLIVTAEPYYAVSMPSDRIVMENVIRTDTTGKVEEIEAKYELYERGTYQRLANPLALKPDKKVPLELYEARNAVQIARGMGADRFATESFQKAEKSLSEAEAYQARNAGKKPVSMTSRAAVQTAEDSRAIAVKGQLEQALMTERQAGLDRETLAESNRAAAQSDARRVTREAEVARIEAAATQDRLTREKDAQALASVEQADRAKRTADAEVARLKLENEATSVAAAAEANRLKRESDAQLAAANQSADRLKEINDSQRAASEAEALAAKQRQEALVAEKTAMRVLLLQQFNAILQTRDTARGLIVNMSDVLFDTGKHTLRPAAREKLAKVAGIVSGHPGLSLAIEGYTDSVGSNASNQRLSEDRGNTVREYLTEQGMASSSLSSKGFGESMPVATNDTASGRQQNRRVELIISGDVIGTQTTTMLILPKQ